VTAIQKARRKSEQLAKAVKEMEWAVADLDDVASDQSVEMIQRAVIQLDRRLGKLDEEQAVRGLGDPAVTSSAPDAAVGHAGELVARGRKTRGTR
jgi:hypothetical protein